MKSMKEAGLEEVQSTLRRNARAYGMGRISQEDHDYIKDHLQKVEARIVTMQEFDNRMREI